MAQPQSLLKVLRMIFQMGNPPVTGESFCWSNSEVGRCGWIGCFSVLENGSQIPRTACVFSQIVHKLGIIV